MTRVEQLHRVLRSLEGGSPDLEACALISDDGLVIASALPQHIDEARVAGMAAALRSLGERASSELARGKLQQVLIRGDEGYVVMIRAGTGALLLALTTREAKPALVFDDMDRAAAEIRAIL